MTRRKQMIYPSLVLLVLVLALLACVTLRSSDDPAPTRRPTLVPTATLVLTEIPQEESATPTPTLRPFPFGG